MSYDVSIGDFSQNITFNLGKFFRTFVHTVYGLNALDGQTGWAAANILAAAINKFATYRDLNDDEILTKEFSDANGWGCWEDAFRFLANLLEACLKHPYKAVRVYS